MNTIRTAGTHWCFFSVFALAMLLGACSSSQPHQPARPSYQLVASWGGSGSEPGKLDEPQGLAVGSQGEVYVTDAGNCRLQVFSGQGRLLRSWGGCDDGPFQKPIDVAVHPSGRVLVADFLLDQVLIFSPEGSLESVLGGPGNGPGELSAPVGLAVDAQGRLLVSEFYNHRIQVFTAEGRPIASWRAEEAESPLHYPTKPGADGKQGLWVADHMTRLLRFDDQGSLIQQWAPSQGWTGRIQDITDVFVDSNNRIHVADSGARQLQLFSSAGEPLAVWQLPPAPGTQFQTPTGLAGDAQGHLYVSDIATNQIHKLKIAEP